MQTCGVQCNRIGRSQNGWRARLIDLHEMGILQFPQRAKNRTQFDWLKRREFIALFASDCRPG
jgi:hypothetical protein